MADTNEQALTLVDDEMLLTSTQVRQHYGGISDMTLWRWAKDPALGFPAPVVINRRKFWKRGGLRAFDASKVRAAS